MHSYQTHSRQPVNLKKSLSNTQSDPSQEIAETFLKLHETIGNLDQKIQILLDKHQVQFLFAWQNHIKKIKSELQEIKQKSDQKDKLMNSNERLTAMQKQMVLFRNQSLRLYEQVQSQRNEIQILRRRIKQQQVQLQILRQQNKQLVKNIKMSEAKLSINQKKLIQIEKQIEKYHNQSQQLQLTSKIKKDRNKISQFDPDEIKHKDINSSKFTKLLPSSLLLKKQHHPYSISKLKQQKQNKFYFTHKWQQTNDLQRQYQNLPLQIQNKKKHSLQQNSVVKTHSHSFMMIEPSLYENELKNWFLQCIRTIKKQISSRKTGFASPAVDIMKVQSLNEFKTIDKLRLLEMFLSNQKLLVYMYQKVFPDRLNEIEGFLSNKAENKIKEKANKTIRPFNENENAKINAKDDLENKDGMGSIKGIIQNSMDAGIIENNTKDTRNLSEIRVKSISKSSKSQPLRNRIIMKDGKLNLLF